MDDWDPAVTNSLAAPGDDAPLRCFLPCARLEGDSCRGLLPRWDDCAAASFGPASPPPAPDFVRDRTPRWRRHDLHRTTPEEQADPVAFLMGAFFSPSEASQAAGQAYIKRLESRKEDRDLPVSRDSAVAQLAAIREWGPIPPTGRYATLKNIIHPTLIVHGNKDIVVAPINALILAEHLPNAQLIVYSDSSHGAHYQHAKLFLEHVKLFLNE